MMQENVEATPKSKDPILRSFDRMLVLIIVIIILWMAKVTIENFAVLPIWRSKDTATTKAVKSDPSSEIKKTEPKSAMKKKRKVEPVKPQKNKITKEVKTESTNRQVSFAYLAGDGGLNQNELAHLFPDVSGVDQSPEAKIQNPNNNKPSDKGNVNDVKTKKSDKKQSQSNGRKIGTQTLAKMGFIPALVINQVAGGRKLTEFAEKHGWKLIAAVDNGNTALGAINLNSMTLEPIQDGFLDNLSKRAILAEGITEASLVKNRLAQTMDISPNDIILEYLTPIDQENNFIETQLNAIQSAGLMAEDVAYTVANLIDYGSDKPRLEIIKLEKR